jgi:translation initiation factor IF-2
MCVVTRTTLQASVHGVAARWVTLAEQTAPGADREQPRYARRGRPRRELRPRASHRGAEPRRPHARAAGRMRRAPWTRTGWARQAPRARAARRATDAMAMRQAGHAGHRAPRGGSTAAPAELQAMGREHGEVGRASRGSPRVGAGERPRPRAEGKEGHAVAGHDRALRQAGAPGRARASASGPRRGGARHGRGNARGEAASGGTSAASGRGHAGRGRDGRAEPSRADWRGRARAPGQERAAEPREEGGEEGRKKRGWGSLQKERRRCRRTASRTAPIVGARWRREVRGGERNARRGGLEEREKGFLGGGG